MIKPGINNLITDVDGIFVGNSEDKKDLTGVTVIMPDKRCVASVDVRGGAPGTRETELLNPSNSINTIDAIVISGGSVFGLEASSSVTSWLSKQKRGIDVRGAIIPIVPSAIIFDFPINPKRNWNDANPFSSLGIKACSNTVKNFELGNAGAGIGATAGKIKGGLGSASFITNEGWQIGALSVVNPYGETVIPGTNKFWAGGIEVKAEFGGYGSASLDTINLDYRASGSIGGNTTISVVATNIILTKAESLRLAIMCQDGIGRAIRPAHTPYDGDIVFVVSTGSILPKETSQALISRLGTIATDCVSRSIARGVYHADSIGEFLSFKDTYAQG